MRLIKSLRSSSRSKSNQFSELACSTLKQIQAYLPLLKRIKMRKLQLLKSKKKRCKRLKLLKMLFQS